MVSKGPFRRELRVLSEEQGKGCGGLSTPSEPIGGNSTQLVPVCALLSAPGTNPGLRENKKSSNRRGYPDHSQGYFFSVKKNTFGGGGIFPESDHKGGG